MFEAVFGTEMPLPLKFVVAFVIVLGLIGGAAYLVRRFGATALTAASGRGRQPRLAVIDATAVDGRRRLVLVRRDNVEHLILIGGPTDLVVEPNIVRAVGAAPQRDIPPSRAGTAAETLPRAVPLPESANPAHEPPIVRPPPRQAAAPAAEDSLAWPLQPEPAARQQHDPPARGAEADRIAGLAANLSRVAGESPPRRPEPRRAPPPPALNADNAAPDMARMPENPPRGLDRPEPPPVRQAPEPAARAVRPTPDPAAAPPPRPAAKLPAYDSLEQEMASLLGRPPGKP